MRAKFGKEVFTKKKTNNNIKPLSNEEKVKIIENVKNKERKRKMVIKDVSNKNKLNKKKPKKDKKLKPKKFENSKNIENNVNKSRKDVVDVCTILEKCNIEEISKYLLEQGKNKDFPDITIRQ